MQPIRPQLRREKAKIYANSILGSKSHRLNASPQTRGLTKKKCMWRRAFVAGRPTVVSASADLFILSILIICHPAKTSVPRDNRTTLHLYETG